MISVKMFSIIVRYHVVTSPLSIPPGNGSFSPVTYTTVLPVLQPVSMLPMTFGKDSQHSECLSQRSLPLLALLGWELLQV